MNQLVGNRKIIPANLRPFDICNQLTKTVFFVLQERTHLHIFFFENTRGYHFRSLESMYAQKPKFNFTHDSETGKSTSEGKENVISELNQIQGYQALTMVMILL